MLAPTAANISFSRASPSFLQTSGKRPKGHGIFSWLYHYYADGVGVSGYDPILGALSPPLRVLTHLAAGLLVSAAVILLTDIIRETRVCYESNILWATIFTAMGLYLALWWAWMHALPGVSVPGPPRPHKMQRQPAWKNRDIAVALEQWRCVSAGPSHAVTQAVFAGTKATLTGEPAGRDLWTKNANAATTTSGSVNEALVQEMASGGRANAVFNPSLNPNRYDGTL